MRCRLKRRHGRRHGQGRIRRCERAAAGAAAVARFGVRCHRRVRRVGGCVVVRFAMRRRGAVGIDRCRRGGERRHVLRRHRIMKMDDGRGDGPRQQRERHQDDEQRCQGAAPMPRPPRRRKFDQVNPNRVVRRPSIWGLPQREGQGTSPRSAAHRVSWNSSRKSVRLTDPPGPGTMPARRYGLVLCGC